jgi:hypothetical protein
MITIPQRLFNNALLLALRQLTADLEQSEHDGQRRDKRIQEFEQRLQNLEGKITRLREQNEEMWERFADQESAKEDDQDCVRASYEEPRTE